MLHQKGVTFLNFLGLIIRNNFLFNIKLFRNVMEKFSKLSFFGFPEEVTDIGLLLVDYYRVDTISNLNIYFL